jgi:hypothetical protein
VSSRDGAAKLRLLLFACAALSLPVGCHAAFRPARRIEPLVAKADRVVRGTVESAEAIGEGILTVARDGNGFEAPVRLTEAVAGERAPRDGVRVAVYQVTFRVATTVKGASASPGSELTVQAYRPHSGPVWRPPDVGQHGLLLLDANGALAELDYPLLPISPDAPVLPNTLPPLEAVGQYFLLSLRPDTPPTVLESCLGGALDLGIAAQATESLRVLAASSDPAVQGVGLWGLVELKDPAAVRDAVKFTLTNATVPELPAVQADLSAAILRLGDPSMATSVLPLLSSPDRYVRSTGIDALRKMRAPVAVPALTAIAVGDADVQLQWSAAAALGDMLGIESTDALAPFEEYEKNPQPYRDWWARWWDTEGRAKYAAPAAQ